MKLRYHDLQHLKELKLKLGYNNCPLCKNNKSLSVSEYTLKCMSPGCLLHTNFSFVYLLEKLGYTKKEINELKPNTSSPETFYERVNLYTSVFEYSKKVFESEQDTTLTFLNNRGYGNVLSTQEIGYLPIDPFALRKKFNPSLLEKHGLVLNNFEPFSNRIIFPVYDNKQRLIHFNARSLDETNTYRWMSSSSMDTVAPINHLLFNTNKWTEYERCVYITEGISDGLSILELNYNNVLSSFGLEPKLEYYNHIWENTDIVIAIYDNDVYDKNSPLKGQYKSWGRILIHLLKLRLRFPHLKIICVVPPTLKGVKDLNDWLLNGLTNKVFNKHIEKSLTLEEFSFEYFKKHSFSKDFITSLTLAVTKESVKNDFCNYLKEKNNDDFILELTKVRTD